MKPTRTHIAAGATVAALGALTAGALSAASDGAPDPTTAASVPVEVRTEVVHRTIKVVRREKPRTTTPASGPAPVPATRAVAAPAPAAARTATPAAVRTASSPGGARGDEPEERERHGRDEAEREHGDEAERKQGDEAERERGDEAEREHGETGDDHPAGAHHGGRDSREHGDD